VELLSKFIDFLLHLDVHLQQLCADYGAWIYLILFVIIFCETGLVFTPFLPGDSLLFACGALAGQGMLNIWTLCGLLIIAAILGDTVNYWLGKLLGPTIRWDDRNRIFKKRYLDQTHAFYERYGGKTIVIARFVPIVRTFAPFVAGIGTMNYPRFLFYNVTGGIAWVLACALAGYLFGGLPFVKENFELVVLAIILVSILPAVIEFIRHKRAAVADPARAAEAPETP